MFKPTTVPLIRFRRSCHRRHARNDVSRRSRTSGTTRSKLHVGLHEACGAYRPRSHTKQMMIFGF